MKKNWIHGFIIALLVIWFVSASFIDSITAWVWDPSVQCYVVPGNATYSLRSEGWGTTKIGEHGIIGIDSVRDLPANNIILWGDSYVEALQVSDRYKMAHQFNIMWNSRVSRSLNAVSIGRSGKSVADYYYNIPYYEKIIPGIKYHCIILGSMDDLLPDRPASGEYRYVSVPDYKFIQADGTQKDAAKISIRVKRYLNILKLQFAWNLYRDIFIGYKNEKPIIRSLRFKLGSSSVNKEPERIDSAVDESASASFTFAIAELKKSTHVPIVFIYCPTVPRIKSGSIRYDDEDSDKVMIFTDICAKNNIRFINLGKSFIDFYEKTKKFPRGFDNTFPGEGHLNKYGHNLVANALVKTLEGE